VGVTHMLKQNTENILCCLVLHFLGE
jgi:hypothetical protein